MATLWYNSVPVADGKSFFRHETAAQMLLLCICFYFYLSWTYKVHQIRQNDLAVPLLGAMCSVNELPSG